MEVLLHMCLEKKCRAIREIIVRTIGINNVGHLGGSLSIVEILVAMYYGIPNDNLPTVILSKGHAVLSQYIILSDLGIIEHPIADYGMVTSPLQAHPSVNVPGISFPSGSLGQGISGAAGIAYGRKKLGCNKSFVYVVLGDGELNEGQVTEALDTISILNLNNMKIIIDFNGWQLDGLTNPLFSIERYRERLLAYDFSIDICDGHNLEVLISLFQKKTDLPHIILARTTKGKGVRSLENDNDYHGSFLRYPEDYNSIIESIEYEIY